MNTYAIVLHFDSEATKKINEFIEAVSKRTGNTYMIDTNIPPHITVGCYTAKEDSRILAEVKEIIGEIKSGSIVFDEMKVFEPKVLFLSPKKNAYITGLNERIYEDLFEKFEPGENKYYIPENWIPHCALAVRMKENEIKEAMKETEKIELPLIARVTEVALAKCNPYKEIHVWTL